MLHAECDAIHNAICSFFVSYSCFLFFEKKKNDEDQKIKMFFFTFFFVYFGYVQKSICISLCSLFIWRWFVTKVLGAGCPMPIYILMMLINVLCKILNFFLNCFSHFLLFHSIPSSSLDLTVYSWKCFLTWIHCLTFSYPIPMINNKWRKGSKTKLLLFIFFFFFSGDLHSLLT